MMIVLKVAVVVGNKKIVLENDIHVDYENEIIIA